MPHIILVPQMRVRMRYSDWWWPAFQHHLREAFGNVTVLGLPMLHDCSRKDFSVAGEALACEMHQMEEYLNEIPFHGDEIVVLMDLSFPGTFYSALIHKRPARAVAFCHASAKNRYDIFASVRGIKWPIEVASAKLFDRVLVATEYHKRKLGWPNVVSLGALPSPPYGREVFQRQRELPFEQICCVSRPTPQKVTTFIERCVERELKTHINRPGSEDVVDWHHYCAFLQRHQHMIVSSKEETYGYQVIDAVVNGCIPICPNRYSYPELLPPEYLYDPDDPMQAVYRIRSTTKVPTLLCQDKIDHFFDNFTKEIMDVWKR